METAFVVQSAKSLGHLDRETHGFGLGQWSFAQPFRQRAWLDGNDGSPHRLASKFALGARLYPAHGYAACASAPRRPRRTRHSTRTVRNSRRSRRLVGIKTGTAKTAIANSMSQLHHRQACHPSAVRTVFAVPALLPISRTI